MALDDVQHVEAVSIIRRLANYGHDPEAIVAAEVWLEKNHPPPSAYVAAAESLGSRSPVNPEEMGV